MIEIIAGRIAEGIKRKAPEHPASIAIMKHALAVLINTISIIVLALVVAIINDKLPETLTVMCSFALLRMVSGGLHLKSGTLCVVVSTTMIVGLSMVNINEYGTTVLNCISLVLAVIFAPTDIKNQSRIPQKYYPILKVISVLMIALNLWISSSFIAVAFFAQAILLLPILKGGEKRK